VATRNRQTERIVEFLRRIGLAVEFRPIDEPTVLPGMVVRSGGLVIDEAHLLHPGDLLHEAGHLAVLPRADRARADGGLSRDGGNEMAAIAWSYAAALHIGLAPEVVFHADGYRDGSDALLENFREGRYLAVPLLQWMGLTLEPDRAAERGCEPFPHMIRWLRDEGDPDPIAVTSSRATEA
jgi:hypothetical protein